MTATDTTPEADTDTDTGEPTRVVHATYDPTDDKIRLYPYSRLSQSTYERVKAAGFQWAPKRECFYAVWSPGREDVAFDLAGDIDAEDSTQAERAEVRAERFEGYADNRERDALAAKAASDAISGGIPMGQPILVGHHSEKRARKDAERIKATMTKAVKNWDTAKYWESRARDALAHAAYKEKPAVRHRRIKTLEADLRKQKRRYTPADEPPRYATETAADGGTRKVVWCGVGSGWVPVDALDAIRERAGRWERHLENRIAYEKAMLGEAGGIKADGLALAVGGQILVGTKWLTITKRNVAAGKLVSVSTNNTSWPRVVAVEKITDYRTPTGESQAAAKTPPLCNYPGRATIRWMRDGDPFESELVGVLKAEWDRTHAEMKGTREVAATDTAGRHRVRTMVRGGGLVPVWLTDQKVKLPPAPGAQPALPPVQTDHAVALAELERQAARRAEMETESANPFERMKDTLAAGVQVVSSPDLFPTPPEVAERVVGLAMLADGHTVLEPSAGTGRLIDAVLAADPHACLMAVEVNQRLADALRANYDRPGIDVCCGDFLTLPADRLCGFDRVVMNPPFSGAADVEHVFRAASLLNPGGRLVAVVANGPRQRAKLTPHATEWIDLPPGSFRASGTDVNAAIVVIDMPAADPDGSSAN